MFDCTFFRNHDMALNRYMCSAVSISTGFGNPFRLMTLKDGGFSRNEHLGSVGALATASKFALVIGPLSRRQSLTIFNRT